MMKKPQSVITGLLLMLAACQSAALQPALSTGGADNRQALEAAVSEMLGGVSITLADDAFTERSELSTERRSSGVNASDRVYDVPEHFKLWAEDGRCVLEHVGSERKQAVPNLSCRPAP